MGYCWSWKISFFSQNILQRCKSSNIRLWCNWCKIFWINKNYWYEAVKNNKYNTNQILAVVANKIDLFAKQIVNNKDGKEFADKIGAIFQTIFCHEDSGVNALFDIIGKIYIDPYYFDIKKEEIKKQYLNKKLQEQTQKKTKIW